jgi:isoquinoline 1-oxidoreductase beta subunit
VRGLNFSEADSTLSDSNTHPQQMPQIKRRHFLIGSAGAAGALIVGWLAAPPRQRLLSGHALPLAHGQSALNGWVKVGSDNTVTVMMAQAAIP